MSTAHQGSRPIRFAAVGLDHCTRVRADRGSAQSGLPARRVQFRRRRRGGHAGRFGVAGRTSTWTDDSASLLRIRPIDVIVTAAVPDRRSAIAVEALTNGKDVVADKPGCVTLDQLDEIEKRSRSRVGSGRSRSRSASRCAARSKPESWSERGGSGGSCRPWVSDPHREGDRAHLAGGEGRPEWFYDRDRTGRHHHRHRQPPDRPVPVVHRRRDGRGRLQHRRQLHPSRVAAMQDFGEGDAALRKCPRLRPRRLVHPAGPADVGRRPAGDLGHRGLHRTPQVRRRRPAARAKITCS